MTEQITKRSKQLRFWYKWKFWWNVWIQWIGIDRSDAWNCNFMICDDDFDITELFINIFFLFVLSSRCHEWIVHIFCAHEYWPETETFLLDTISIFDLLSTNNRPDGMDGIPLFVVGVPSELNKQRVALFLCQNLNSFTRFKGKQQQKKKCIRIYSIHNRQILWYLICMRREVLFRIFLFFFTDPENLPFINFVFHAHE